MNRIRCNVNTCKYNDDQLCKAAEIEVGCCNCIRPCCDAETECNTFAPKE